jgi:hypothetical protein
VDPVGDAGVSQLPAPVLAEGLLLGRSARPLLDFPKSGAELGDGGGRGVPPAGSLGVQGGADVWASELGAGGLFRM